jgi:hypothetical protein
MNESASFEETSLRAQELIRGDRLVEAENLLRGLPRGSRFEGWFHERTIAVIRLAERHAELDNRDEAWRLIREALEDVQALQVGGPAWVPAEGWMSIARTYLRLGSQADALAAATQARTLAVDHQSADIDCAKLLVSLAELLGQHGMLDQAEDTARAITIESYRSSALEKVFRFRDGGSPPS